MRCLRKLVVGATLTFVLCSSAWAADNVKGKVLETMNGGGYTYLKLASASGEIWAAIPQTQVTVGQEVSLQSGAVMNNFPSKTLNRTFESIIFSGGLASDGKLAGDKKVVEAASSEAGFAEALRAENTGHGHPTMATDMPANLTSTGSGGAVVPSAEVKVEKVEGENGYTVGEVFERAEELKDKTVRIRGKVMKVSKMIMGKNWLHLQDGTGDPMKNSHDLVVTTMAEPAKDSVVVVEGVLHTNKDFGFGYFYQVIVEDAAVK